MRLQRAVWRAGRFGIGVATAVRRVRRLRETGGRKAPRQGYPKRSILDPHEDFLLGLVAGEADVTLDEMCVRLRDACGIMAARVTIRRFCYRRGITFKERRAMHRSRSAYFKTMYLAFRKDDARDWRDQLVISLRHSGAQHSLQFHHVFPQAVLKKLDLPSQKVNDICNLSFVSGSTNRRIRDKKPAIYLPDFVEKNGNDDLAKQCIPNDSALWTVDAYDRFLSKRRELIATRLNQFLGHEAEESSVGS